MTTGTDSASQEWRNGWPLVLAGAVGYSLFSIMANCVGAFMEPLGREFGFSRTLLSAGLPLAAMVNMLFAPFIGLFVDRRGARGIALPGIIALALCICGFSFINGSPVQWFALWTAYAFAAVLISVNVWSAAVAGAFSIGRGLALGAMLTGTAVAQAAIPPVATLLIDHFGWRTAFVWLGVGWGGVTFAICYLCFMIARRSEASRAADAAPVVGHDLPGLTIREAWRDSGLQRIAVSTFLLLIVTIGLIIHQIPILTEAGVTREHAAWLAGLGGLAGIAGKIVTGWLMDRFRPNLVGGLTIAVVALAFLLLLDGVRTPVLIVIAMVINGYAAGCKVQICSYLTSRYGGLRNFGTIFGFMSSLIALGSAIGPVLAGKVYDMTGGYTPFLIGGGIACVICGLLIVTLPAYPDWGDKASGAR
ncbi:MAG TPA: MFS transporter [Novosphingobium sp.]